MSKRSIASSALADVLVFSAPGGHDSTSARLQLLLTEAGITSEKVNMPKEMLPLGGTELNHDIYTFYFRHFPAYLSKRYHQYLEKAESFNSAAELAKGATYNPLRLLAILAEKKPKLVISTFGYGLEIIARVLKDGKVKNLPIGFIPTDYGTEKYWIKMIPESATMTFAPDQRWEKAALDGGLPANRIMTTGLPVNPLALTTLSEEKISELRARFNFKKDLPTVVVASGTGGVSNVMESTRSIVQAFQGKPIQILIGTGTNASNYGKMLSLKKELPANVHLEVVGYDKNLPLYMRYLADVAVSKPGGITTTEVVLANKPFVLISPGIGQEKGNLDFFVNEGMAIAANYGEVGEKAKLLLEDHAMRNRMLEAQKKLIATHDDSKIIDWVSSELKKQTKMPSVEYSKPSKIELARKDCSGLIRYVLDLGL